MTQEEVFFVKDVAEQLHMSVPGAYRLRDRMRDKGIEVGQSTGIKTGSGEIIIYSAEDIVLMREHRSKYAPSKRVIEVPVNDTTSSP